MTVLGDVAQVIDCEHRTAPRATDEPFGYSVGTGAVRAGRVSLADAKPVSEETYRSWTRRAMPSPGDLIFSREAPMGEVAAVPAGDRVCLGQRTVLLRVDQEQVEQRYLLYLLMAPQTQRWILANAAGSTVLHLNVSDVRRIPLPHLPSLREQHRIVTVLEDHLSRLDAAEGSLLAAARRCEVLVTAGLWEATHDLPDSEPAELGTIAEVRLGRQRSPKNHTGDRMRPYLRAANVDWDKLRLDDVKQMQFSEAEEERYRLATGDILLTEASGSASEVGKSALYEGEPRNICFQNTLLRVRCVEDEPAFVQKYLLAEARAGRFMPDARGVGINHLGRARLAKVVIQRPSIGAQKEAVLACEALITSADRLREAVASHRVRCSTLRKSVLASAFAGHLLGSRRTGRECLARGQHLVRTYLGDS